MELPSETLHIQTPENVAFGYEVAGIGSRFLAAMIDTAISTFLQMVIAFSLLLLGRYFLPAGLETNNDALIWWIVGAALLLLFAIQWGYYILFEVYWNGQSPGKRWVGLRVIQNDGTPITVGGAAIRNLIRLVDMLPAFYGIGLVTMFIDRQSRRLGDLAAGTLVVLDKGRLKLESLGVSQAAPFTTQPPETEASLPVHLLSPADLRMAEEFLHRRSDLANRQELGLRIARSLAEHMRLSDNLPYPLISEQLIENVVRTARSRIKQ
jgi:uncharacterized RDD family membrane protein YckC